MSLGHSGGSHQHGPDRPSLDVTITHSLRALSEANHSHTQHSHSRHSNINKHGHGHGHKHEHGPIETNRDIQTGSLTYQFRKSVKLCHTHCSLTKWKGYFASYRHCQLTSTASWVCTLDIEQISSKNNLEKKLSSILKKQNRKMSNYYRTTCSSKLNTEK